MALGAADKKTKDRFDIKVYVHGKIEGKNFTTLFIDIPRPIASEPFIILSRLHVSVNILLNRQ